MPFQDADVRTASPTCLDYNATRPLGTIGPMQADPGAEPPGAHQRHRRAVILAAIRQLILEEGADNITVRRIAECSGHAVQTVYNLVGPRDAAITEAISEYCRRIGLTTIDASDPGATVSIAEQQLRSIEYNPEFYRQVCLMFFGKSRNISYLCKDRQAKVVRAFLLRQQRSGVLKPELDAGETAMRITLYLSALCIEWADGRFALPQLRQKFYMAYADLLTGVTTSAGAPLRSALTQRCASRLN